MWGYLLLWVLELRDRWQGKAWADEPEEEWWDQ